MRSILVLVLCIPFFCYSFVSFASEEVVQCEKLLQKYHEALETDKQMRALFGKKYEKKLAKALAAVVLPTYAREKQLTVEEKINLFDYVFKGKEFNTASGAAAQDSVRAWEETLFKLGLTPKQWNEIARGLAELEKHPKLKASFYAKLESAAEQLKMNKLESETQTSIVSLVLASSVASVASGFVAASFVFDGLYAATTGLVTGASLLALTIKKEIAFFDGLSVSGTRSAAKKLSYRLTAASYKRQLSSSHGLLAQRKKLLEDAGVFHSFAALPNIENEPLSIQTMELGLALKDLRQAQSEKVYFNSLKKGLDARKDQSKSVLVKMGVAQNSVTSFQNRVEELKSKVNNLLKDPSLPAEDALLVSMMQTQVEQLSEAATRDETALLRLQNSVLTQIAQIGSNGQVMLNKDIKKLTDGR